MTKAIKCDICKRYRDLKDGKWDEISFDKANDNGAENEEYWQVCKFCKSKVKEFIKVLEKRGLGKNKEKKA